MDVYSLLQQYLSPVRPVGQLDNMVNMDVRTMQELARRYGMNEEAGPMPGQLPPQDEVIRTPMPPNWLTGDMGIVARPYTGPQTGDPVINRPRYGTWDRTPGDVRDWNRPFAWENYKRGMGIP